MNNQIELLTPILSKLEKLDKKIDVLEAQVSALEVKFEALKAEPNTLETKFESRFDTIDAILDIAAARLNAFEIRFDADETRLGAAEARLDTVEPQMDSVETRLCAVEARLNAVENSNTFLRTTLENETHVSIQRIAEGHLDLSRNLQEARVQHSDFEVLTIKVNMLQTDVNDLKRKIS